MEERIENGNYVKVKGFITLEGLDGVCYEIEQISSDYDESGRDVARFETAHAKNTEDLGRLLVTDPRFAKFRDQATSFGELKPSGGKFFVHANDIEYDEGKFGYMFERPATFEELTEIVRAYNEVIEQETPRSVPS